MRHRRGHRKDKNEAEIVAALRAAGVTVWDELPVDLLCFYRGKLVLLEVKNPDTGYGVQPDQMEVLVLVEDAGCVVTEPDGAIEAVTKAVMR